MERNRFYPKGTRVVGNGVFDITHVPSKYVETGFTGRDFVIKRRGDRIYLIEK